MHSVKVTIEGGFWDSQLYAGDLILFTDDGAVQKMDWRAHINAIADANPDLQTALRVAFMDGDLFYNEKVRKILKDPAIDSTIRDQLEKLAKQAHSCVARADGKSFKVKSPFDFYPADTDIYYGTVLAAGEKGLYSCRSSKIHPGASPVGTRRHDASFLQVKASQRYTTVAAAGGGDGLFEFAFEPEERAESLGREKRLSPRPCKACEWSFESVLGWTETDAFLAKFKEEKHNREKIRRFDRVIGVDEIFNEADINSGRGGGLFWGSREKLYKLDKGGISVIDLIENESVRKREVSDTGDSGASAHFKGTITSGIVETDVIATGTAPFGTVIELSDRVVVLRSDGLVDDFMGEPVHWRVFPRSNHYSNQLHIVYEDRIEIVSFVHDYFVDQTEKKFGFYRQGGSRVETGTFL